MAARGTSLRSSVDYDIEWSAAEQPSRVRERIRSAASLEDTQPGRPVVPAYRHDDDEDTHVTPPRASRPAVAMGTPRKSMIKALAPRSTLPSCVAPLPPVSPPPRRRSSPGVPAAEKRVRPRRRSETSVLVTNDKAPPRSQQPSAPVVEDTLPSSRPHQPPVEIVDDGPAPPRRTSNPPSKGTLVISRPSSTRPSAPPAGEGTRLLDIPPPASLGHVPSVAPPASVPPSAPPPAPRSVVHTTTPASGVRLASLATTVVVPKARGRIARALRECFASGPMLAVGIVVLMVGCFLVGVALALAITHPPLS